MVRGIWMMLQQESPKEFILASGKTRTIKEFVHAAFQTASIDGKWIDDQNPLNEKYEIYVPDAYVAIRINKNLYRPTEVGIQRGDYTAIKNHLGWEPQISFEDMVKDMIENDKNTID
jgi:GDPmannose 4,6-dehydratase